MGIQPRKEVIVRMPDNRNDQSQSPAQRHPTPVQENIHTTVTVTTDRALEAPSAAQLQSLEETIRKNDYGFGF
jgi:hypothetical protein